MSVKKTTYMYTFMYLYLERRDVRVPLHLANRMFLNSCTISLYHTSPNITLTWSNDSDNHTTCTTIQRMHLWNIIINFKFSLNISKFRHILTNSFVIGFTRSCHFPKFQCSQRRKYHQNNYFSDTIRAANAKRSTDRHAIHSILLHLHLSLELPEIIRKEQIPFV